MRLSSFCCGFLFLTNIFLVILYAFANVDPSTGIISLTDPYADEQVCYRMQALDTARMLMVAASGALLYLETFPDGFME